MQLRTSCSEEGRGKRLPITPIPHWARVAPQNFNFPRSGLHRHECQLGSLGCPVTQLWRSRSRKQAACNAGRDEAQPDCIHAERVEVFRGLGAAAVVGLRGESEKTSSDVQELLNTRCMPSCRSSINICSMKRPQVTGSQNWKIGDGLGSQLIRPPTWCMRRSLADAS